MAADRLHGDDTPIRVLDPSVPAIKGRRRAVKEGRIWAYVHDDRPWGGSDPPAVAYYFSPDRKGEHPQKHLAEFRGILQADAYAGFRKLYEPGLDDTQRIREAACRVAGDVATPGPHRSGRAGLPHPVPHGGASLPTVYW
jgi:hypothetical protein